MSEAQPQQDEQPDAVAIQQLAFEFAKIRYEAVLRGTYDRSSAVTDFAMLGLRSLILTNGGALVGLVTFIGNFPDTAETLGAAIAFVCFIFGLVSALFSVLFSYLSQQYFFWSETNECDRDALQTFGLDTAEVIADRQQNIDTGKGHQWTAIGLAIGSAVLFIVGGVAVLVALLCN